MRLRMWTYDLAREQAPTLEHLIQFGELTQASGYNALGLYLEHRFAYPSAPWAHGKGSMTPDDVRYLIERFPDLQIIPFINLLGHFEGMLYTEEGARYAAERFAGMQADPTNPEFVAFCERLVDDTLGIFNSEIVHLGGDETWQLGKGRGQEARMRELAAEGAKDPKAELYGRHFGPLAQRVLDAGRRPGVWGDMFVDHPSALRHLPKETVVFDWQYFKSPRVTAKRFLDAGHDVVLSPTIHVYDAAWCHLPQSERNVVDNVEAAHELNAMGVCVTTWEGALFANYETLMPAIRASGELLSREVQPVSEWVSTQPDSTDGPGSIVYNGNPELPNPDESGSVGVIIVDNLIIELLRTKAESTEIEPADPESSVYFIVAGKREQARSLLYEMYRYVARRFRLLAGLSPLRDAVAENGTITGWFEGRAFTVIVQSIPTSLGPKLILVKADTLEEADLTSKEALAVYQPLREAPAFLRAYLHESERHEEWARLMGIELQDAGGPFTFTGIRSSIKCRLLLYSNPFLLWLRDRDTLCGEPGGKALDVLDRAISVAPDSAYRGASEFVKLAVQFVRFTEEARQAYADHRPGDAITALSPARALFDDLARIARSTNLRIGGSLADVERCQIAKEHVERVIRRVKAYGDGHLGYLPSFETITHPKFVPHDQANWWLINSWANE